MKSQKVSVIITTHNRKNLLVKAIDSAISQTYKDMEIIVLDDASIDGTFEVVLELSKKYNNVVAIRNDHTLGFVDNLNKGVNLAKGYYVAILNDDDIWADNQKLQKQVNFLEENPDYVLTGGGVIKINKSGKEMVRFLLPEKDEEIRSIILVSNMFVLSNVVFRKKEFLEAGEFKNRFGFFSDRALWLEMGKLGKFYNFPYFFSYYLDQEYDQKRSARDYEIRRKIFKRIKFTNEYKQYYKGFSKALLIDILSYAYSFIPFRRNLNPLLLRLREIILGRSPYNYYDSNNKKIKL